MKVIVSYPARIEKEIEVDRKWDKLVSLCEKYPNFDKAPQEVIDYYNDNIDDFLKKVQEGYAYEICVDTKNGNSIVEI